MKVSIIIPVYNVEAFLPQCVESVLQQKYSEMEIILVDDGSQDGCGAICDKFAAQDSRIKVIHKPNGGLSDARNAGIAAATGDFVLFLDSDDLWEDEYAITTLVERVELTGADVLNFSYVKWFEDTDKKEPYFQNIPAMPRFDSVAEQLNYLTTNGLYIASACNKFIRRSLLVNLPFDVGVYSEDIQWCAKLLLRATSMDFICSNFYLYRQRSGSIRYTINDKKCADLTNHILACIELVNTASYERKNPLLRYIAFQLGTFFMVQAQAENLQTNCIQQLKDSKWVLKHCNTNRKIQILDLGCKILSFPLMCLLIRIIYHRK